MRPQRGAFGDRGGEAAGVIEVWMRIDDKADRLVRYGLLRRSHYCHAARIALAAFDNKDMVAHVDRERA